MVQNFVISWTEHVLPVEVTRTLSRNSFLNKSSLISDPPPNEQQTYQEDFCLSIHPHLHDANGSGQDRQHLNKQFNPANHLHPGVVQLFRAEAVERAVDVDPVADGGRPHKGHLHFLLISSCCSEKTVYKAHLGSGPVELATDGDGLHLDGARFLVHPPQVSHSQSRHL